MIKISLDESYVFDILTIYQVKINKSTDKEIHINNFNKLFEEISDKIGKEKMKQITNSQEYDNLFKANMATFDLVDRVKSNPHLGLAVDQSNYDRYLRKVALQEKFFELKVTETKIGY
jgi:hypothetical protein